MVDLFADKVSGRSNKGDFDQTPYAASARVETAHVDLAMKPTASTGERGGWAVVSVRGMHLASSRGAVGKDFLEVGKCSGSEKRERRENCSE